MAQKKKVTKKPNDNSVKLENIVLIAAAKTWNYIAAEARQIGVRTAKDALEFILDANRIESIGGLKGPALAWFNKMPMPAQDAFLLIHKKTWWR